MVDPSKLHRSPRAMRNERQARVTRLVLGLLVLGVLAGAGYGVSWLRKQRGYAAAEGPRAASRPDGPESAPARTETEPATSPTTRAFSFRADQKIAELKTIADDGSVESMWQAALALRAEAAAWKAAGAPEWEFNKLLAAALDAESWILQKKPGFPEIRAARGEVKWTETLGDFEDFDTRFLTKADGERLTAALKQLEKAAARNHGWVVLKDWEAVARPLVEKAAGLRKDWDEAMKTPVGRAAREVEIRDLAALRTVLPGSRFRPVYHLPYLFLVEQDARWEEQEAALPVARALLGLRQVFFATYGQELGIVPQNQRAVPVILFASRDSYHRYCAAKKEQDVLGTEAHFEAASDRLVLHAECALSTILHEGTHQLIRANVRAPLTTYVQSFWFHEGVAEWFAGSRQIEDGPDGLPRYEIGLLMPQDLEPRGFLGPIAILKETPNANRFPLKKLIGLLLKDRDQFATESRPGLKRIHLVYAQGWFLIYFLNHFDVDEKGVVVFGTQGKYRDLWIRYLKREILGSSGEATFMEALDGSGVKLEQIESEMSAYLDFVIKKIAKGQVKDQKLVPSGPEDDRLK